MNLGNQKNKRGKEELSSEEGGKVIAHNGAEWQKRKPNYLNIPKDLELRLYQVE